VDKQVDAIGRTPNVSLAENIGSDAGTPLS